MYVAVPYTPNNLTWARSLRLFYSLILIFEARGRGTFYAQNAIRARTTELTQGLPLTPIGYENALRYLRPRHLDAFIFLEGLPLTGLGK